MSSLLLARRRRTGTGRTAYRKSASPRSARVCAPTPTPLRFAPSREFSRAPEPNSRHRAFSVFTVAALIIASRATPTPLTRQHQPAAPAAPALVALVRHEGFTQTVYMVQ